VLGLDGSPGSRAALDWAIGEAAARTGELRVLHALAWPALRVSPVPPGPDAGLRDEAERLVEDAVRHAHEQAPHLTATGRVRDGRPSAVLLEEAADAALVVLGSRGAGGFADLPLGSVGAQVAAHATCPVVVVRPAAPERVDETTQGRVLIGVDGGTSGLASVGFGFEEAKRLGTGLTAIHCTRTLVGGSGARAGLPDNRQVAAERRTLAEALQPWAEKYPDVDVRQLLVTGQPAATLAAASHGARLVVVGARGLGGFSGLRIGSVSQQLLHHAGCPVAVVRRDR
jgi:nucleotide-binding universal stress UspA family protein